MSLRSSQELREPHGHAASHAALQAARSGQVVDARGRGDGPLSSSGYFHLFTYGTLKSAVSSPAGREMLRDCERIAEGTVAGTLYDAGEYPALLLGGGGRVSGEVWRCPSSLLRVLDRYEGAEEGLFRRVAVEVDGTACWVYVAGPKLGPRLRPESIIETGSWSG